MSALAELRLRWRAVTVTTEVNGKQLNETIPRHELRLALEALDVRDEALRWYGMRDWPMLLRDNVKTDMSAKARAALEGDA
jgi:hypothetical protein